MDAGMESEFTVSPGDDNSITPVSETFPKAWLAYRRSQGRERELRYGALRLASLLTVFALRRHDRAWPVGALYIMQIAYGPGPVSGVYGPGLVKVGFSVDPEKRRRQLQASMPWDLNLLGTVQNIQEYHERIIHSELARVNKLHVRGEWYDPELRDLLTHIPQEGPLLRVQGHALLAFR